MLPHDTRITYFPISSSRLFPDKKINNNLDLGIRFSLVVFNAGVMWQGEGGPEVLSYSVPAK
jgi:hypothetical protein